MRAQSGEFVRVSAKGQARDFGNLRGGSPGLGYFLGWLFLYRSIRKKLGLGRVREAVSGAVGAMESIAGVAISPPW